MRTFLKLPNVQMRVLPPEFQEDDVRYTDALVAHFLREFTMEGQVVFDPFAGYGTTLIVAEALGRVAYGLEYTAERVEYIRSQVQQPRHVIQGDARRLLSYGLPRFDFSMTSPPYLQRTEASDPLTNYAAPGAGYDTYLDDMRAIYVQMAHLMQEDAHVVVEVANLKGEAGVTPLAWDLAATLSTVLHFEGELVIGWDHYGYGYDHSYCLLFTKP